MVNNYIANIDNVDKTVLAVALFFVALAFGCGDKVLSRSDKVLSRKPSAPHFYPPKYHTEGSRKGKFLSIYDLQNPNLQQMLVFYPPDDLAKVDYAGWAN